MFKLYGKKTRCVWCGRGDATTYHDIKIKLGQGEGPEEIETIVVCSEACENDFFAGQEAIQKRISFFLVGMLVSFLLVMLGLFFTMLISQVGVAFGGLLLVVFPFAAPFLIRIFGFQKALVVSRMGGVLLFLIAFPWMAFVALVS